MLVHTAATTSLNLHSKPENGFRGLERNTHASSCCQDIGETSEEAEDLESQERFGCIEEPEELVFQPDLIRLNLWTPTVAPLGFASL